jgi:hypothetical protein
MAKRAKRADDVAQAGEGATAVQRVLEEYLTELNQIRATGAAVEETSYYPALANLFNAVGRTLKPKVRCNLHPRNQGGGIPDGGLYTADQFQRQSAGAPKPGQLPSRGAIEVKGTKPDVMAVADSQQVAGYLKTYGIVLVTNLRSFVIVDRGPDGKPTPREAFHLAANEQEFWRQKAAHPRVAADERGPQFLEFIKRACLHAAPLAKPKDLAWFVASYARDALARVERQKELPALQSVRAALEEALGMKFTDEKGEHFFRSTLVQTLFYGVFSAWVRWHRDNPGTGTSTHTGGSQTALKFDWQKAEWSLHVPFIRVLYEEVAKPSRLGPLGLVELLDWTAAALNRVSRGEFFQSFEDEHAVQYFYEPFLEAYDPDLRKELGVWYTPREIVKYQVARVDTVLREELGLARGLADENVVVLDPCCGTGAYLVEVLRSIAATLRDEGGDALVANDLKKAAINRVFGFEIMPAPFVVAHLQLGLTLQSAGVPLAENERVGVYLTNALTGWEPPKEDKQRLLWTELEEERDAADHVKRDKRILVVLGNPPYNAFAGVSPEEEQGLVEPYKNDLNKPIAAGGWGIKKFNLDDLCVRFFRLAERRIAEMTGQGIVSFISNFSYLTEPSFVVMRQRLVDEFDKLWFDCLNGDSRETGKLTPEGDPDPSVFSTEYNREGIKKGTAVCVIVRGPRRAKKRVVRYRSFWGVNKRAELLNTLKTKKIDAQYAVTDPGRDNRFVFIPQDVTLQYTKWPMLTDLCGAAPLQGMDEDRGNALVGIDKQGLSERTQAYLDAKVDWRTFSEIGRGLARNSAAFDAKKVRDAAIESDTYDDARIRRYLFRPLDTRHCYYTDAANVWKRHRPELVKQAWETNGFVLSRSKGVASPEGTPMLFSTTLLARDCMRGHAVAFPIRLRGNNNHLFDTSTPHANLSEPARAYLDSLGVKRPDGKSKDAALIWMHALAIGYSPAYLSENADGVRRDWPRIPLPADREALEASAALGEQLAALLDTEAAVPGVTSGKLAPLLKTIGLTTKAGGGSLDPARGDLAVTAGWAHRGQEGVTMPAKGRIETRAYDHAEQAAMAAEAAARETSVDELRGLLGATTCDVFLNDRAYWRNVPINVWQYTIGGYQVMKKWLSYREREILGRDLQPDEAREVMNMARRIAGILLMQPQLDANYRRAKDAAFDWSSVTAG